ncbi:hypothetical protein SAMN05216267_1010102 [Actinacidiphila rubida]|uniref:Uncharacterized protein n=1 Tax=Actinacidiphila rubida TaxID=310780 RepID=A0A1H8JFZ3_9ACTN|nr:hypothetical protein SAMN05216267_1010102 [Actinacidiphila rubida]
MVVPRVFPGRATNAPPRAPPDALDVFKRHNWGNVAGGEPRDHVGPGRLIPRKDLARLYTDGYAQDLDVRGSTTF